MQFVNRNKLLVRMTENGLKNKDVAEELCLTYSGFYSKIKGTREFTENEIYVLARMFGHDIFYLDNDARKMRKKE